MLGLGRAMGETIAVALVIGAQRADHVAHLLARATRWRRSSPTSSVKRPGPHRAALIGLGVVLFVITIVVNVMAARLDRAHRSGARRGDGGDVDAAARAGPTTRPWILERAHLAAAAAFATARDRVDDRLGPRRARPARLHRRLRRAARACRSSSWSFLTEDLPIISRSPGRRHRTRDRRHDRDHRSGAAVMAIPLGVLAAIYLNEYGGQKPHRAAHPVHGRRHDRCAVDRDGPVHRTIWVSWACTAAHSGFAGSLALGALMLPIVIRSTRGDAEARARRPAAGERRARRAPVAHDVSVVLPAALPGIVSGVMLAIARAAGETAPLLFTIGVTPHGRTRTRSRARTPRCRWRSGTTRKQPFPAAQDRAWGAALTLIVIVFVLHRHRARRVVTVRDESQ